MFKALRVAFFLAFKAIRKGNIGITVMTILMLVLVGTNLLFVPGLIQGIVNSANNIMRETYSGDIIIEIRGDNPTINHSTELVNAIASINGVAAVTARNTISAAISYKDETINCVVSGVMPDQEVQVFDTVDYFIEGGPLDTRDRNEIVLGVQAAGADREHLEFYSRSLRTVHAGDRVTVKFNNGIKKQYTVKGIFHTGFLQTDLEAYITNLEYESVVPLMDNKATSVRVKLDQGTDRAAIIEQIKKIRDGLDYKTWEEVAGIVTSMTESFQLINRILNVVNFLVAGITVFIVTYVDVVNRRRQIGIQRAIGIKPRAIVISYLIRAFFYAVIGLFLALLLFEYVIVPLEIQHPFYFPFGAAYLSITIYDIVRTFVILLLVALIAAYLPVGQTMRIKILDAIWG